MVRLLTEINTLTNMKTKSKSNITGQKKKKLKRKRLKMKTTLNFQGQKCTLVETMLDRKDMGGFYDVSYMYFS